jgi:Ca-activated chloride channel family protein
MVIAPKRATGHVGERVGGPLLAVSLFLLTMPRALPQTAGPGHPAISVDVSLVVLQVTVRDLRGEFVSGLGKDAFQVLENGRPQNIRLFQHEDLPVSVGLLVDNSGSMGRKRNDVAAAALAFVRSSNPRDEMFVVDFNEKVILGLPDTKLFSATASELELALNGVPAYGGTALYDAIETGLAHVSKATRDKKVLILISDGGDNSSRHTLREVLADAGRSNVLIYAIGLLDEHDADQNPKFLKRIARVTGGEAFFPAATEVTGVCKRIAEDIRQQYTIGYVPADERLDDTYRAIKVTAHGTQQGKLRVRTRTGYIASRHRAGAPLNSREQTR